MNLKQLSMVQRLSLCFGALLGLLLLVLFISVRQIDVLHDQVEELVERSFPKTIMANNVIDESNNIARAVRTMLIARDDPGLVAEERERIEKASASLQDNMGRLQEAITSDKGRELLQALRQALAGYETQLRRYLSIYDAGNFPTAQSVLLTDLRDVQQETLQRVNAVIALQNSLVEQQGHQAEEHATSAHNLLLIIGAVTLLVACLLVFLLVRGLHRQLGADPAELAQITASIATGNLDLELPRAAPQSVMESLRVMLGSLQASAAAAASNARIKSALDNCTTNVMIADNERNIIYMNKTVSAMMQNAESDLRKVLPSFAADKLLGGNMDQFHKNPEHQKRLLANLGSTYRTQIEVGGRTFSLIANPVLGDNGERLGSVVEWNDRTLEVRVEREVADLVNAAALGDFTQRVGEAGKAGFFLNLATGLNQLMETADKGLRDVVRVLGALAKGDLTERIDADYQGTFGQLKDYSNETAGSLSRMLGQIRLAADTIYTAASEISAGNTDLSSRTEEQASSLEQTASSMEELTSTVKLNADNARQANSLAVNASEVAVDGGNVVNQVVETMSSINESARKIADIIGVIDGIAFQTNILALNAAVEAARAGEQGRGFAVVAGEVRNLAQRSAAAAKEIKTLISDSVDKVNNGNALVAQAGKTMSEIVISIKRVTDIMAEIAAASAEQSTGIEEISGAVSQMDEMTQQNAALVEEAAASAESLLEQATEMSQAVAVFKFDQGGDQHAHTEARKIPRAAHRAVKTGARQARTPSKSLPQRGQGKDNEWEEF